MHHYLTHLIADMHRAAKNLPAKPYYDIPPEAEGIEYVIEWENAEAKPMHEWFGIAKENFPPAEKLTDDQLTLMVKEILGLWAAYKFFPNLPENLPAKIVYQALVGYLDRPIAWVSEGESMIELCDLDPENCPFTKEYCLCKDLDDDGEMEIYKENAAEIAKLDKEIKEIEARDDSDFLPEHKLQRYVEQLLKDILAASVRFFGPEIIPLDADGRGIEDARQLAENPFVTLEELTSIKYETFPTIGDMDGLQTRRVLRAMLVLLDACHIKIDFPPEAPHEIKYEALRDAWDSEGVQHLPLSGMDFDLCTGEPKTCPYGDYCNCGHSLDFTINDVPEDYQLMVKEMAEYVESGQICFLNLLTYEMENVPIQFIGNPQSFEHETGKKWEETFKYERWEICHSIEPPNDEVIDEIALYFTDFEEGGNTKFHMALANRKPDEEFEDIIKKMGLLDRWIDFKERMLLQYVWRKIKMFTKK